MATKFQSSEHSLFWTIFIKIPECPAPSSPAVFPILSEISPNAATASASPPTLSALWLLPSGVTTGP